MASDGLGTKGKRDQGETLLWTRFTPGALVQSSPDPNRTIFQPSLGFGPLLKSRSPLKVDRMRHGPTKPKNGSKMVRFGSADLWSSALGVKRVRGSVSPWSRDRPKPKKTQTCQNSKNCPRSTFRGDLLLGRSIFREGCVNKSLVAGLENKFHDLIPVGPRVRDDLIWGPGYT